MTIKKNTDSQQKYDLPIISFTSSGELNKWFEENHSTSNGIWLKMYKKGSGIASVYYKEALDEALCFGWIDGQAKKFDDDSYLQRFTPRRAKSIWSKKNVENVTRLLEEGRMRTSGLKQIESAKTDGRWEKAYDSPVTMTIPEDFLLELSKDKKALAFFESLNRTNKYAIVWRLQTAIKPETREKRMKAILEMMASEKKFH